MTISYMAETGNLRPLDRAVLTFNADDVRSGSPFFFVLPDDAIPDSKYHSRLKIPVLTQNTSPDSKYQS